MRIKYKSGYKYQLVGDYIIPTGIQGSLHVVSSGGFIELDHYGALTIRKGYAWDGPSGPAIDTRNFMRGSLVHDALYQLIREELLPSVYKTDADELLRKICIEDGMSRVRAWWVYWGLQIGGAAAANPENKKAIHTAP